LISSSPLSLAWARSSPKSATRGSYRAEYKTFAEFCQKEFNRSRDYVYRLISAHDVVEALIEDGVKKPDLPKRERVTRELSYFPRADRPAALRGARELAIKEGREEPEVKHIRQVGAEISPEGKARQIKALIDKLRSIEKSLPESIGWSELDAIQRSETVVLLLQIAQQSQALAKKAKATTAPEPAATAMLSEAEKPAKAKASMLRT
jgi:hypothetical protein